MDVSGKGMLVSVVVPVYNDPEGIEALLPRLLGQTLEDERYEIVIVDNQSTDGTVDRVKHFQSDNPERITLAHETDTQGSYAARNRGIEVSKGKILAFTDADCRPASSWLEAGLECFEEGYPDAVAGCVDVTTSEDPTIWEKLDANRHHNQSRYVEEGGWGETANLFVARSCFERFGRFDATLRSGGDAEFGRRVTDGGGELIYSEEAVVEHPARSSARELLAKNYRIGKGLGRLYRQRSLGWNPLHWTEFFPVWRDCSIENRSNSSVSWFRYCLARNLVHYANLSGRLMGLIRS